MEPEPAEVLYDSEKGLARICGAWSICQATRDASLLDAVRMEDNSARHYWEFMAVRKDDSDETLLAIAREGEGVAAKVYRNALAERSLAPAIRRLLEKQPTHLSCLRPSLAISSTKTEHQT